MMFARSITLLAAALLVSANPVGSGDELASGATALTLLDLAQVHKGLPFGWQLEKNDGKVDVLAGGQAAPAERSWVGVVGERDELELSLLCRDASFSLNREIPKAERKSRPILEWEWQGRQLPARADMRDEDLNDQALQVLVQLNTTTNKIMSYVWDTTAPVGTTASESYALGMYKVKVLCVESGADDLGKWQTVRRDLRADYKLLYGSDDFPGVSGIRIQSNSQYTKGTAAGSLRRLDMLPAHPSGSL